MKIDSKKGLVAKRSTARKLVRLSLLVIIAAAAVGIAASIESNVGSAQQAPNSCIDCHSQLADQRLAKPTQLFDHDIHREKGLTCTDCHGGDSTKTDKAQAKSPMMGYTGKPTPQQIPAFCGKCHSDANLMKKFDPSLRVDQVQEYYTSVHGKRLQGGDTNVATCVSCHGVHGIRPPEDPTSSVFAGNVAETCSQCHSSGDKMQQYGIPTDQYAKYKSSVHANALYNKHDMSAPTCNDCHGNHGAAPPGLDTIANVCGTCHSRQNDLFTKGPHKAAFEQQKIGACIRCHTNHAIQPPTDAMAGVGQGSVCTSCHQNDKGFAAAEKIGGGLQKLNDRIAGANKLLDDAEKAGMEVSKPKFELKEANDALTQSRVLVHTPAPDEVQKAVDEGMVIADKSFVAGESAFGELSFRRKGLVVSLFFILFLAGLVYLKLRQIERDQPIENAA